MESRGIFVRPTKTSNAAGSGNRQLKPEVRAEQTDDDELSKESGLAKLETTLARLKQKVQSNRSAVVVEKMESNRAKLSQYTGCLNDCTKRWEDKVFSLESFFKHQRVVMPSEGAEGKDDGFSAAVPIMFSNNPAKQTLRTIKLTPQQNVPPYTTWIYLDRNQRMTEDQSVQGRRRIYYDPVGNETLIASDSEEEEIEEEEPKHEFSKGEDFLIWMTVQECGVDQNVFEHIAQSIDVSREEVQARYETIANDLDKQAKCEAHGKGIHTKVIISPSGRRKVTRDQGRFAFKEAPSGLEADFSHKHAGKTDEREEKVEAKDLVAAMDSFDNLFCRRCLVFDCRLHGCSQPLVHPSERQPPLTSIETEKSEPCGRFCYMLVQKPPPSQARSPVSSGFCSSPLNVGETSFTIEGVEKGKIAKRQKLQDGEAYWSVDKQIQGEIVFTADISTTKDLTGSGSQDLLDTLIVESGKGSALSDPADALESPKRTSKVVVTVNSAKKLARSLSRKGAEEWGLGGNQAPSLQTQKSLNAADQTHVKFSPGFGAEAGELITKLGKRTGKTTEVSVEYQEVEMAFSMEDDTTILYEKKSSQKALSKVTVLRKGEEFVVVSRQSQTSHSKGKSLEVNQSGGEVPKDGTEIKEKMSGKVSGKTSVERSGGAFETQELQISMPSTDSKRKGEESTKEEKSRETFISAKKLARKARKSLEKPGDVLELDNFQSQAVPCAGSPQDSKPQKEERTRNTAAKKLARSSRNSIAQKISDHLQTQIDPKSKGVDDLEPSKEGCNSTGIHILDTSQVANEWKDFLNSGDGASVVEGSKSHGKRLKPMDGDGPRKDVDRSKDPVIVEPLSMIYPTEGALVDSPATAKVCSADKWTPLEKGLYEKGLQIFGRNSCLIAKNMLKGCKTCVEVAEYITAQETAALRGVEAGLHQFADSLACVTNWDNEIKRARAKFFGKKKGSRRLKFTLKSAGQSAIRKRMNNGKDMPCRQFTPCGCLFSCGKQCPCQLNGTCCEKYCGCAKGCKNRFRGCHCAKSQCCSRQCPCFAAGRECDPDVCRNCWIGCGAGHVAPPLREDKEQYTCHNMKLLLKQQQRVLLSRSDVAGWGAFLKSTVNKHDYLGEYTGELISHREADKRGKIYDRENSSFLFNLNDQYVLDACRKGDKLKFANHSPNPNCYAKVIMVAGDHRVGIFAKERINAGEELFYDYRYEADRAPSWAKKGEDAGNGKKDDSGPSSGRGAKQAS
ncbi:protein MpCXC3 [Marchantia polymorpha subsp. ruderalis]|uniref:Uncharacterized protein n=2 Tax=Marchantia polymorpha TaxID=3197 RepID=A0AAF6BJJ9_MARPO|nr:hypothetical protein MARPO_0084s0051 [Marchantia polymorpha]BBN12183.1 hypothetical protein Mp_5g18040 [Marchantia polymorpha subsp. ruderalis]|eukprot:PTQ33969.1 hypothetical protein MARPO_0084s0051 [Marchantia polymorpha]